MPRLFLLRHAKSSWDDSALDDFSRPLNLRGRAAGPLMGRHIADHGLLPERVLCSSARRTRDTFAAILPYLAGDFDARFLGRLYQASAADYLDLIRKEGGKARTLLMIGHNPAIQEAALSLIGLGNPELKAMIGEKFPTAALAMIDFDGEWSRVTAASGRIVAFFRPRELEAVDATAPEVDE